MTCYEQLPIRFTCGGRVIRGIPAHWRTREQTETTERGVTKTTFVGVGPEGLELRVIRRQYGDFDAREYVAFLTNRGSTDSPLVEDIRMEAEFRGTEALLYHGNGDTKGEDGYHWQTRPLTEQTLTIAPCGDGTSCNGAFPYMRLLFAGRGVNLAFGWTGTWVAQFTQEAGAVRLSMGQQRCRMVLRPGETMRVPSLVTVAYEGDEDMGRNVWRHWYFAHILTKDRCGMPTPKCCMHLFEADGKPEFTGATEENQLAAIEAYLAAGLRPDVWWIDAGWYPCDYNWLNTGTWRANKEHFPRGLEPVSRRCRQAGMDFLLWFEPERIRAGTEFALEHPQWILSTENDGPENLNLMVDLSRPDCCDYVIELLDGLVKEYGVDIYRQDFNLRKTRGAAGQCWIDAEAEDRLGAMENLHIQGYYRLWDALLERNPGLLIDSCAGGGRRNDIETMRRSVTLHYTDVGYGNHPIKLLQHRQMFEWIPYFRAHNQNWCADDGSYDKVSRPPDRYSYYAAMAPSLTDVTEFDADPQAMALARQMQAVWRRAAELMLDTDYYPLTPCRASGEDLYAAQFDDPKTGRGFLHLVNGAVATQTQFTLGLKGLLPQGRYRLRSEETGRCAELSGQALMEGFAFRLEKHSGDIWFYERV